MNTKANIILVILFFVGLAAYQTARWMGAPTASQLRARVGLVVPELLEKTAPDIQKIEISSGKDRFTLERGGGADRGWYVSAKSRVLADSSRVDYFLTTLKQLRPVAGADPIVADPKKFGLEPPEKIVKIYASDTKNPLATIEFGSSHGEDRYVREAGRKEIEVVQGGLVAGVDLPPIDWRDRSLFQISSFNVDRIKVGGSGRDLDVKKEGETWRLESPIRAVADPAKLEGIVAEISGLRAVEGEKGFVADDVKDFSAYGLDHPTMTIDATPSGAAEPQKLAIGAKLSENPNLAYARRLDQDDVMLVDISKIVDLGTDSPSLRSKRISDLNIERADFMLIVHGENELALVKRRGTWRILFPKAALADAPAMIALLTKLRDLETTAFLNPEKAPGSGLDHPSIILKVWQGSVSDPSAEASQTGENAGAEEKNERILIPRDRPNLWLEIGRRDPLKKTIFARSEGDPAILAIPDVFLDVIPVEPIMIRDRGLTAQSPALIDRVKIRRGEVERVVEPPTAKNSPDWVMTAPVRGPADTQTINRLVPLLASLRAERLVSESPKNLRDFGLLPPILSVTWRVRTEPTGKPSEAPNPGEETTLIIGKEDPDRKEERFAMISGNPVLFTLGKNALSILFSEIRDRHIHEFDINLVDRVSIHWRDPGIELKLSRKISPGGIPDSWIVDPTSDVKSFDRMMIQSLLTNCSRLIVGSFVQDQGAFPKESGLVPARLKVALHVRGELADRVVKLGASAPGGAILATADAGDSGAIFDLNESMWRDALKSPQAPAIPEIPFAPAAK